MENNLYFGGRARLIEFKEITYIKYLNKLIVYDVNFKDLNLDDYYLFYDEYVESYFLIKFKYSYSSKTWEKSKKVTPESFIYVFSVVKQFKTIEDKKSYHISLQGFSDVIDDSNYYDDIPLVNEIWHDDNYIISNVKNCLEFNKGKTIDTFKIHFSSLISDCFKTKAYHDKHHERK